MINPLTGDDYNGRFYQGNNQSSAYQGFPDRLSTVFSGDKNTTTGGLPCMGWDSENDKYPHSWLLQENHNFCRNPDDGMAPWCYTRIGWDLCFSDKRCDECLLPTNIEKCRKESETQGKNLGMQHFLDCNKFMQHFYAAIFLNLPPNLYCPQR